MTEKRNMDFFDRIEPYSLFSDLLRSLWAIIAGALAAAMITIMVNSREHLETIMANLRKINSVLDVERAIK